MYIKIKNVIILHTIFLDTYIVKMMFFFLEIVQHIYPDDNMIRDSKYVFGKRIWMRLFRYAAALFSDVSNFYFGKNKINQKY